jgi:Ca2+-binding EF-hand superfamily protein
MVSSISSSSSFLSQMLLQAMQQQQRQDDFFSKIDSNSDGSIDKAEFSALAKKMSADTGTSIDASSLLTTYDTDSDGVLSKDELDNFMKENAPPPPDTMSSVMSQVGTQAMDALFNNIDTNGDGEVSTAELAAYTKNLSTDSSTSSTDTGTASEVSSIFSQYASNSDGTMSEADLEKFMKENAPPPPPPPQNALSAYAANSTSDQTSELIKLLQQAESSKSLSISA